MNLGSFLAPVVKKDDSLSAKDVFVTFGSKKSNLRGNTSLQSLAIQLYEDPIYQVPLVGEVQQIEESKESQVSMSWTLVDDAKR